MIDVGRLGHAGGAGCEDEQRLVLDGQVRTLRSRQHSAVERVNRLVETRMVVRAVRFAVQPDARRGFSIGIGRRQGVDEFAGHNDMRGRNAVDAERKGRTR